MERCMFGRFGMAERSWRRSRPRVRPDISKASHCFFYNPQAHKWGQYFVDSAAGVLNQPQIGEFKNGRGELFGQQSFNGRTIFVRFVWSDITPKSHHVEQSFSDDGGKTWEPNFVATLTRDKE